MNCQFSVMRIRLIFELNQYLVYFNLSFLLLSPIYNLPRGTNSFASIKSIYHCEQRKLKGTCRHWHSIPPTFWLATQILMPFCLWAHRVPVVAPTLVDRNLGGHSESQHAARGNPIQSMNIQQKQKKAERSKYKKITSCLFWPTGLERWTAGWESTPRSKSFAGRKPSASSGPGSCRWRSKPPGQSSSPGPRWTGSSVARSESFSAIQKSPTKRSHDMRKWFFTAPEFRSPGRCFGTPISSLVSLG